VANTPIPADSLTMLGLRLVSPDFYVIPLVAIGVLLAVGMVGSIAVARDTKERE
jgi:NADH:ubiquinone oxidoreductase subunit 6 (subunit J)